MQNGLNNREYCSVLKSNTKKYYKTIKSVYSPALKQKIIFNSIGFRHLQYKPGGTSRKINEIIYKLILFPLVISVIKNSVVISEERNVLIRINRKKGSKMKKGKTYSLVSKVGRRNPIAIRVIILRVGKGNFVFYSVMKD